MAEQTSTTSAKLREMSERVDGKFIPEGDYILEPPDNLKEGDIIEFIGFYRSVKGKRLHQDMNIKIGNQYIFLRYNDETWVAFSADDREDNNSYDLPSIVVAENERGSKADKWARIGYRKVVKRGSVPFKKRQQFT